MSEPATIELVKFISASGVTVPPALDRWTGGKFDMDLMKSIETQGLLQPIGVHGSDSSGYTLSWGSRRLGAWLNSPFLQNRPIPAVVVPASAAMRGTLDENAYRRQLTALDKARVAKYALETTGNEDMTLHDLAEIVGLSSARVASFRRVWQSKELWDRVDGEARFPLEAAITLSALPADKRNAFLQDLDSRQPKPKTAEIMQLAREWQGSSVTGRLKVSDVASNATAVFEHFVHGSPGVNALDIEVAYEKEVKAPTMRLVLPLQENGNDAARDLLARGSTLAGDVPPLAAPSNSPAPPAPATN